MSTRITRQQLESYLWRAPVLLRGTIDAGGYKQFIFPLVAPVPTIEQERASYQLGQAGGLDVAQSNWLESSHRVRAALKDLLADMPGAEKKA